MKKSINAFVFVAVTLITTSSFSYSSDPKTFITELVGDAITTLSDKNISIAKKKQKDRDNCSRKC